MGEDSLAPLLFDRTVEQAIVSIKKGAYLLKCGRRGKPKLCPFRLSPDERNLIWYSGQQEKHLRLSAVTEIIQGQGNIRSQRQDEPEKEGHSFSLIYANGERSLDLICKDKTQAALWFVGLRALISRCQHPKPFSSLRSCKGVQSCVSSPAGIFRRKKNLGLLEETPQFTQVHSLCASPALSLSERCLSDGLSYTSDNIYSPASLSSRTQGVIDNSVPRSPYIDPDIRCKAELPHLDKGNKKNFSYRSLMPPTSPRVRNNNVLKDVMVWGGGIGGHLGVVSERFANQHGIYSLVPKLLESTMMLDVQNIALGGKHAALVTKQGEVFCWGQGKWGRLGQKIDIDISSPKIVDSLNGIHIKHVACGEYHTCALTDSGEVYTWGNDACSADLGYEWRNRSPWIPHKLSGPLEGISISSVACGEWHTAIVSSCGRLFTYGEGTFGVLGHGDVRSFSQPKEVESLSGLKVRYVACGSWHTAAIVEVIADRFRYNTTSGKLFTWGDGDEGRLGHADNGSKFIPTCVSLLVDYDFVQVSCGRMLTVALTTMGKVFAMGSAKNGQLGNPHARDKAVMVEGLLKQEFVKVVSCGAHHVAVLTSAGSIYTWGKGENGQLGLGDCEDRYTPSFVESLRDRQVDTIICGPSFTAAICLHKPISISDQSACSGCRLPFGFTRKKHNCYNCGLLFCHACSSKKATNASLAPSKSKAFRVCDQCFNKRQGSTVSEMASKSRNYNTQQVLKHQNKIPDLSEDRGETTVTQGPLLSISQSCYRKSMPSGRKDWKNQQESQQQLQDSSSVLGGVSRWGQVPCPGSFNINCTENSVAQVSSTKHTSATISPMNIESTVRNSPVSETDTTKSDKLLIEEVERLRAEARRLEEECELKNQKIQECQLKVEESWNVAKEEAAKSKAAKEVIKALALRLHTLSGKDNTAGQEEKIVHECLPNLAHIQTDIKSPKVGNMDSLSNSPIVFSDTLKSKFGRSQLLKNDNLLENSNFARAESQEDSADSLKAEWVEQYEPGVYITLTTLSCGKKGLKRVRFSCSYAAAIVAMIRFWRLPKSQYYGRDCSCGQRFRTFRKRFAEKEAERWWEENQATVYHKYDIEGYTNIRQSQLKG